MKKEADMIYPIANAPCSWGVDDPKNPNLPAWATVLKEAAQAGYRSIELGPWGYLPTDPASLPRGAGAASAVAGRRHDL